MQQRTFDNFANRVALNNGSAGNALINQATRLVELLQAQPGGPHGYRLRRIILTNFWLYGRQEFEIPHGRLFLAGENASGKSTVLTAALPLGLDGDLRPNRLDTFGGRERRIEYYVLGGSESATPFSYERRTSYIALEFEWCDPDSPPIAQEIRQRWENGERESTRFLTIGLSIAGNANVTDRIRPLRFLITDGSRLGYDIDTVYETGHKNEVRAYDHPRFKQLLEGHGIICESQAEYERQVSRYLFGFNDVKDFEKLINLLLILRRPNLSTELNFSRVHEYLKISLRKISSETTSRVIGTIERIDTIQNEMTRIQEAFNAAERVHQARQHLALTRAQLAACEYAGAQLAEDAIQNRATKLQRDLSRAANERKEAVERAQTLSTEQDQISGQIKALEATESLQVATQLTAARERTREAEAQLRLQEQSLESARHAIETGTANLQRQEAHFARVRAESVSHLQELSTIAVEEALWETAAFQLKEALQQINVSSTEAAPTLPTSIIALLEEHTKERTGWLRELEALHRQREQLESKVQYARNLETTRFQELDEARRRFQDIQDRASQAQQKLYQSLEQFTTLDTALADMQQDDLSDEEESHAGRIVEQFAAALNDARQMIERLEKELVEAIDLVQSEMDELHLLTGRKMHEVEELKTRYEQKQAEPEFAPQRSTRRTQARAKLAEHTIAALPLYTLLDFAPDLAPEEAGRIEYALEDAGLLDALVVAPTQLTQASELLAQEGLSDCLLNINSLASLPHNANHHHGLRFDSALLESTALPHSQQVNWQTITGQILVALGQPANGTSPIATAYTMNDDGAWTHGLLTGRASSGMARCIGKATRLRVRQTELEELNQQRLKLEEELQRLISRLADYEQQLAQLQDQQVQLRKVISSSGLEEVYAELAQAGMTLDAARTKYQKARQQTQEMRLQYNTVTAQLERASQGIVLLASDAKRVQVALMGVVKLANQARSLQSQLTTLSNTWEECQKAREALERAKSNERNVFQLYERIRHQHSQAQAETNELQHVASLSNIEELSQRLGMLRERNEVLSIELDEARQKHTRVDERCNNIEINLAEAGELLQGAQQERMQRQSHFVELLAAYPVEELAAVQQAEPLQAVYMLLGGTMSESDVPARKELLEIDYRDAYSGLARTFNHEQPTLLEYGPDLDDQGHVLFLNENRSRPIELMQILGERIALQKSLLDEEERQLFENFLLQEIAEAIRTHILEAEEWVQQINGVLSNLPMIGEHYSLQWKAPAEYDMTKLGSHLARHHRLLRKPAQALTPEETETLMNAFRREIESVRLRQQETPDTNFMEVLEQVFDYREWFHFDVWVTPIGGQRQRLTDRVAGTRSGAEQLFALYVPLFAALGALYKSAAPGAPRLLALDEAFDKVSTSNTQRIIEFLVSQDFQWIMTGPQVSGAGTKIAATARYLMIHEKGSTVATASASFWSDKQSLQMA